MDGNGINITKDQVQLQVAGNWYNVSVKTVSGQLVFGATAAALLDG